MLDYFILFIFLKQKEEKKKIFYPERMLGYLLFFSKKDKDKTKRKNNSL